MQRPLRRLDLPTLLLLFAACGEDPDPTGTRSSRARVSRRDVGPPTPPAADGGRRTAARADAGVAPGSSPTPAAEASPTASSPPDNVWNTRIDDAPVDPRSDAYIAAMGADDPLVASWDRRGRRAALRRGGARTRQKVAGALLGLPRRERPRPLPHSVGCADGPQQRPPRHRRGPRQRLALRAVRRLAERPTAPGTRPTARSGTFAPTTGARSGGRPQTQPACPSSRASSAGTRWTPAGSAMPSASR